MILIAKKVGKNLLGDSLTTIGKEYEIVDFEDSDDSMDLDIAIIADNRQRITIKMSLLKKYFDIKDEK